MPQNELRCETDECFEVGSLVVESARPLFPIQIFLGEEGQAGKDAGDGLSEDERFQPTFAEV